MSENKLQAGSRRYIASAVIGATLLAGVMTATLGVGSAEAQEVSKTLWKPNITSTYHYATQQTVYTTASKTVRAYDIDGDKKKDVLTLRFTRNGRLVIGINGTRAKSIKASFDAPDPHIRVRYLKTKNNRPFLYVQYTGPNDDGVYAVYQGKKRNRLVKVAANTDFPK